MDRCSYDKKMLDHTRTHDRTRIYHRESPIFKYLPSGSLSLLLVSTYGTLSSGNHICCSALETGIYNRDIFLHYTLDRSTSPRTLSLRSQSQHPLQSWGAPDSLWSKWDLLCGSSDSDIWIYYDPFYDCRGCSHAPCSPLSRTQNNEKIRSTHFLLHHSHHVFSISPPHNPVCEWAPPLYNEASQLQYTQYSHSTRCRIDDLDLAHSYFPRITRGNRKCCICLCSRIRCSLYYRGIPHATYARSCAWRSLSWGSTWTLRSCGSDLIYRTLHAYTSRWALYPCWHGTLRNCRICDPLWGMSSSDSSITLALSYSPRIKTRTQDADYSPLSLRSCSTDRILPLRHVPCKCVEYHYWTRSSICWRIASLCGNGWSPPYDPLTNKEKISDSYCILDWMYFYGRTCWTLSCRRRQWSLSPYTKYSSRPLISSLFSKKSSSFEEDFSYWRSPGGGLVWSRISYSMISATHGYFDPVIWDDILVGSVPS